MSIIQMSILITVHVHVQVTQETGEQLMKLVVSQLALASTESKDFCCHLEINFCWDVSFSLEGHSSSGCHTPARYLDMHCSLQRFNDAVITFIRQGKILSNFEQCMSEY